MGRTAIIFPGQGSQLVGMGADVARMSRRAAGVYEKADDVLGIDLSKVCFDGPAERLACTDNQQPAILVTSIAILEAILEQGEDPGVYEATAGLSLGEYTSLYFAGSLSFEDAVSLVYRRGQLMQAASDAQPSGMVSLIGADESKALQLCELAAESDVLVPANLNCPGQVVVSGNKAACERAVRRAGELELKAIPLKVAGAFHSPLMQSAADALGEVLSTTPIAEPRVGVVSNVTAEYHGRADSIRELLQRQVTAPVRWQRSIERLIDEGFDRFVEVGPNRVLTGLMRKINRNVEAVCVSTADDLAALASTPSA